MLKSNRLVADPNSPHPKNFTMIRPEYSFVIMY